MKKNIIIVLIVIILDVIFIFSNKTNYSELENRYLQNYPKFDLIDLKNGSYTDKINNYLQDNFPFRSLFVNIKTNIDKIFKNNINGVYIGENGYLIEEYKTFNKEKVINIFNNFSKDIKNAKLLLVPTSIEINKDKLPNYITSSQYEDLLYIYNNIDMDSIDIYDDLINSKYQTYYKLDHHWTIYGSYIGYKNYMESINKEYVDLKDLNIYKVTDNFYGSIYSKLNDYTLKPDTILSIKTDKLDVIIDNKKSSLYDKTYLNRKDKYSYFLSGNHGLTEITNNNCNGSILVIKDSYGNSLIPYLTYNYNKIYVVDLRYFKGNIKEFIKSNNIDETLILFNMNTITTETGITNLN